MENVVVEGVDYSLAVKRCYVERFKMSLGNIEGVVWRQEKCLCK